MTRDAWTVHDWDHHHPTTPKASWARGWNAHISASKPLYDAAMEGWRVANEHIATLVARAEAAEADAERLRELLDEARALIVSLTQFSGHHQHVKDLLDRLDAAVAARTEADQ